MKKHLFKKICMAIGAVALLNAEATFGNSDPNTNLSFGAPQTLSTFGGPKSHLGLDGKIRILWDTYNNTVVPQAPVLNGSVIWILDSAGKFLASSPPIPLLITLPVFSFGKSNLIIQGQADGNTTIVFIFSANNSPTVPIGIDNIALGRGGVGTVQADRFAVWTLDPTGKVISASPQIGPFAGTVIEDIKFVNGKIVVHWLVSDHLTGGHSSTHAAWTLNEFGAAIGASGTYGPFLDTDALVTLAANGIDQLWQWDGGIATTSAFPAGAPGAQPNTLGIWNVNAAGTITASAQYGPF
jgi:hypothetical protein